MKENETIPQGRGLEDGPIPTSMGETSTPVPGINPKPEPEPVKVGIEDPELEANVLDALRRLKRGTTYSFTVYAKGPIQEKLRSGRKAGV